MNRYLGYFEGKEYEVFANTSHEARQELAKKLDIFNMRISELIRIVKQKRK